MRIARTLRLAAIVLALWTAATAAQEQPPVAAGARVEIKGEIERVLIARGRGMPSLEVRHGSETTRVFLGSMRYLVERNFNPKAGEPVEVKGFKSGSDVVAATVTLTARKKELRLRDDRGFPLWRGGGRGRGPRW